MYQTKTTQYISTLSFGMVLGVAICLNIPNGFIIPITIWTLNLIVDSIYEMCYAKPIEKQEEKKIW